MINSPETEYPRGCQLIRHDELTIIRYALTHAGGWARENWGKKWIDRENRILNFFQTFLRSCLFGDLSREPAIASFLSQIEPETRLSFNVLLAQGLVNIKENRLVIEPKNRIGLTDQGGKNWLANGNRFRCGFGFRSVRVTRLFEGEFAGVVLNTDSRIAKLQTNQTTSIYLDETWGLIDSTIGAQLALIRAEREQTTAALFSQQEMNRAIDWVLFSGPCS